MKTVFIGLGKMGSAICTCLLKEGVDLTVYNRTAEKMTPLVNLGAKPSESISEAVLEADLIFTCLLDDKAVLEASKEIAKYAPSKAVHVGLSTVLPDTAKKLLNLHNSNRGRYISAVVLGVPKVALQKQLTVFCAGNPSLLEKMKPYFNFFSGNVVDLGENISAPNIMKICMNYSLMTSIELFSELYTFAIKSGLDTEIVRAGFHQIFAHPAFKLYIDKIHSRNFDDVNFDVVGGNKDVTIFQKAFAQVGISSEIADIVKSRYLEALDQGMQDKDWSCIYEIVRKKAGLKK